MAKILLLEDDLNLAETVQEFLEEEGYTVDLVYDGEEAKDRIYENSYDLLLLDVNVPGMSGFELLRESREESNTTPAIFMTSLNAMNDLQTGYDSGCDDYLRKPFELQELLLRIQTLLRRQFSHTPSERVTLTEEIQFNPSTGELIVEERSVKLKDKEARLIKLFLQHPEELLSHERIYDALWDYDEEPSDTALRTYIKNLRQLIGKDHIVSFKRLGYKFTAQ